MVGFHGSSCSSAELGQPGDVSLILLSACISHSRRTYLQTMLT